MKSSDYEKFQQQIFDQIDELEQTAKQSENKETLRRVLLEFIADGERVGINVTREVDRGVPIFDLIERVYPKVK
jgi:hypothetical protein